MAWRSPLALTTSLSLGSSPILRRARQLVCAAAIFLLGCVLAFLALLAAADRGLLNQRIASWASGRLGRVIHFRGLRIRTLSRHPVIDVEGLSVINPPGFGPGAMLTISKLHAELRPWAMITGRGAVRSVRIDGVRLSLVRIGPDHNNWVTPRHRHGLPAFEPLRSFADFQVHDAWLRFRDLGRHLDVQGQFEIGRGPRPFHFSGKGMLLGAPIVVAMAGGPLHGAAVGPPYPFSGRLQDGATRVDAAGTSVQPFDLSEYHLNVSASGPNLADLGYLFHLLTPNSAPFGLSAYVTASGGELRVDHLGISTAESRITGTIWSDHRQPRRDILANFRATLLHRDDINAMLAQVPTRLDARSRSGLVDTGARSRFIISDAPLGIARLRATDLDFRIHVDRLLGYPLAFENIETRFDLDHGVLAMPEFHADLFGGDVRAQGRIDARANLPVVQFATRVRGMLLARFPTVTSRAASGTLDGALNVTGRGTSFHAAAADARGRLQIALNDLTVPKAAEWVLAGDLVRGASSSLGHRPGAAPLTISAGPFAGAQGIFATDLATAKSPLGTATGNASVDFRSERFCLLLAGHPARKRLLQVVAPVRIEGPWLLPSIRVLPGNKARALGLHGKLGTILTPLVGLIPTRGKPPERCH